MECSFFLYSLFFHFLIPLLQNHSEACYFGGSYGKVLKVSKPVTVDELPTLFWELMPIHLRYLSHKKQLNELKNYFIFKNQVSTNI